MSFLNMYFCFERMKNVYLFVLFYFDILFICSRKKHNRLKVVVYVELASLIHLSTSVPILALAATSSSGSPGAFEYMSTQWEVPFVTK